MSTDSTAANDPLKTLRRLIASTLGQVSDEDVPRWIDGHSVHALVDVSGRPETVQAQCEAARQATYAQNHWRIGVFQSVVDTLRDIPVCPIKGILLLDTMYSDDFSKRSVVDIDLVVPGDELVDAISLLEGDGWETVGKTDDYHVRLEGHKTVLELHRQLDYRHSPESRWNQLRLNAGVVHEKQVSLLPDAVHYAYLMAHMVKHTPMVCLKWVVDVVLLADQQTAQELETAARQLGAFRSVLAGLDFLEQLLECALVPGFAGLAGRRERAAVSLNRRLAWGQLLKRPFEPLASQTVGRGLSAALLADRALHGIRFLARELREKLRT